MIQNKRRRGPLFLNLLLGAVAITGLAGMFPAAAQTARPADGTELQTLLRDFLRTRADDHGGRVTVALSGSRVRYAPCHHPQPYLPGRDREVSGRVTVGVRCPGDRPALRYYQARVGINAPYYVAALSIEPGDTLSSADLRAVDGDITRLTRGVVTDAAKLVGQVAKRRIAAGMPIAQNMVAVPLVVDRGDSVRVIARGAGFSITTDGLALSSAAVGQRVQVKTDAGATIQGVAQADGSIMISNR